MQHTTVDILHVINVLASVIVPLRIKHSDLGAEEIELKSHHCSLAT